MAKNIKYLLLTDVVASRHIADRKEFEQRLAQTIKDANTRHRSVLEGSIKVWKGLDETAALIKEPHRLYEVIDNLSAGIAPQQMRFVLVCGEMDVAPKNGDLAAADGPLFHKAAGLMTGLKKTGLQFDCETGNIETDEVCTTMLNLLLLLKENWTAQQYKIYSTYAAGKGQEEVAAEINITQQAVSKTLKSIRARQVALLEKKAQNWMHTELKRT